jgi:phytoene synthase
MPSVAAIDAPAALGSRREEDRWLWRSFHHHSRTFSFACRLLPRAVHLPIATLYCFCRTVDTLADERVLEVGAEQALAEVRAVREALEATLDGHPPEGTLLWPRLAEVHARFGLDRLPLEQLLDGAEWDLTGREVHTEADLVAYSNLVGGSVGAMLLPFLLSDDATDDDRAALDGPARDLGIAMQITNIVRDVGEDLRDRDRVYLPLAWLAEHGLSPDALAAVAYAAHASGDGVPAGARPLPTGYPDLLERVMYAAETRYERSFDGIDALPWKMRFGIRAAARMYREIMNEVRANGYDNLRTRAYTSLPRKVGLTLTDGYVRRRARRQSHHLPDGG